MCPKQQWDEMNESLENKIEAAFPFKKWNEVKNLMQEILKCPRVCISSDFCLAYTDDNQEFSIIDFLQLATRHVGPNKDVTPSQKTNRWHFMFSFVPLLAALLANHTPVTYIKNKKFLALATKYLAASKKSAQLPSFKHARPSTKMPQQAAKPATI